MKKTLIKCKNCGERHNFWLDEQVGWKCFIDEDGVLECLHKNNGIMRVYCDNCGEEYREEDFKEINFN
jgi:transcription elongation factor Elf1